MRPSSAARSPHDEQPPGHRYRPRRGRVALTLAALASIAFLVGACGNGLSSSSGNSTSGGYSVAFAECMRAHGVPKFPNPNGSPDQFGPGSGVDPASSAYRAALNGPCQSLAPAGWVSSGPVTKGGGS
jgi:hypothetical protein